MKNNMTILVLILLSTIFVEVLADNTLFLAHYDGNTGNSGLQADAAKGISEPIETDAAIVADAKFGAGSAAINGLLTYALAGNFNLRAGTIEMWIKADDWYDRTYQGLFAARVDNNHEIRIQKRGDSDKLHVYQASDAGLWGIYNAQANIVNGQWHHFAWTWDVAAQMTHLYIDGQVLAQGSYGEISVYSGALSPTFMVGSMDSSNYFDGQIDELKISDADLYQGQSFTPQTTPFADEGCFEDIPGDLNGNCIVDMLDLSILVDNWLGYNGLKTIFLAHFDGDSGNLGLDADYADGPNQAVKFYGQITSHSKFGQGAYYNPGENTADPDNDVLSFYRENNFSTRAGTVEMWIRPESWDNGSYQGLFGIRVDNDHDIRIQKRDNNQLIAYQISDSGQWGISTNDFMPSYRQWYHLAWTWDIDMQVTELYIDGEPVNGNKFGTIVDYKGPIAPAFTIGDFDPKGGPYRFIGQIDEVRISNGDIYNGNSFIPMNIPFEN